MIRFIDDHKQVYGVEPICRVLPIAPSTYYHELNLRKNPELRSQRHHRDSWLKDEITRVFNENRQVYGVRKVWKQLQREKVKVARCTVARLMKELGIRGVVRGKSVKTTIPDDVADRPLDKVERNFKADRPNQLWVADLTYVRTWNGFVYTAFITDVYADCIVGWKVSSSLHASLALDALEQAVHSRKLDNPIIHHSDKGVQYLSIKYSDRLEQAGIESSVGSKGDSYDNALAESINALYKAELIRKKGPWKNLEQVEFETLLWVDWFNKKRIMEKLEYMTPDEYEKSYFLRQQVVPEMTGT